MKYELSRIGTDGFERLIQSLLGGITFGDGPDGQREAVLTTEKIEGLHGIAIKGYTVVQVKFKSTEGDTDRWSWLQGELRKELNRYQSKKESRPELVPETWLLFTNLSLSSVQDQGLHDKGNSYIREHYPNLISYPYIFGTDDVKSLLDNNPSVAQSYAEFITPSHVLSEVLRYQNKANESSFLAILEYVRKCFHDDHYIRLDQAGDVTDRKLLIRNVYTDLEAENQFDNWREVAFAAHAVKLGEKEIVRQPDKISQNGLRFSPGNLVLLGEAGQGKSTVCQLLCQLYRAALLQEFPNPPQETADYFLPAKGIESVPKPSKHRIPVLISLKRFAAWLSNNQRKQFAVDEYQEVTDYLIEQIQKRSGDEMPGRELRNLLNTKPWLFCFDGLDEVPATSNRKEVLEAIRRFIEHDLLDFQCDAMVVVTSRPQGYTGAFPKHLYRHYVLKPMSREKCRVYICRLLENLEPSEERRESSMGIMDKAMRDPALSQLLSAPLYVAILLLLARTGGALPSRRSLLLRNYCRTVITREKQKGLLLLEGEELGDDYVWIYHLHQEIAMRLQQESDAPGNPASLLSTKSCVSEIEKYLEEMHFPTNRALALYRAMTTRLPFLAATTDENGNPCVLFPLRSIQEYYAAEAILARDDHNEISEILEAISISAYWRNVFLLAAGFIAADRKKYRLLNNDLLRICRRNCGIGADNSILLKLNAAGKPGAWLALDFLREEICGSEEPSYSALVRPLLESRGKESWLKSFKRLSPHVQKGMIERDILPYLQKKLDGDCFGFLLLWSWAADSKIYGELPEAALALEDLAPKITLRWKESYERIFRIDRRFVDSFKSRKLWKSLTALAGWFTGLHAPLVDFFKQNKVQEFSLMRFALKEAQPIATLRWLLYQVWLGSWALRDFERDSVLVKESYKLNIASYLSTWNGNTMHPNLDIEFRPILLGESKNEPFEVQLLALEKALEEAGIQELSALLRFRRNPQPNGLYQIAEAHEALHPGQQTAYRRLLRQSGWCLQKLGGILERGGTADELLPNGRASWDNLLFQDKIIHNALNKVDLKTILGIDLRFRYYVQKEIKPQVLPLTSVLISELGDMPLRPWIVEVLTEAGFIDPNELKTFCAGRNKELRELPDALPLLFLLFAETEESELPNFPYPERLPYSVIHYRFQATLRHAVVANKNLKQKIEHVIRVQGHWEACSLCALLYFYPPIYMASLDNSAQSRKHWDFLQITRDEYEKIRATGNQLALFSGMLSRLSEPLTDAEMIVLEEDLLSVCKNKPYQYVIQFGSFLGYSKDGLYLLWKVAKQLPAGNNDDYLYQIIAKSEKEILQRLERDKADIFAIPEQKL